MTLEDHLGDILRKARQSAGVSTLEAANAAELTESEYAAIESDGRIGRRPDFQALERLLGLNAKKLEGIAAGWLPPRIDLSGWRVLRQITTQGDSYSVNCYLVWDEASHEAALFDTGFDAGPVFDLIQSNQLHLNHLFITHTHHDHIEALGPIRQRFPKVKLHLNSKSAPADQRNRPGEVIALGALSISYRDTPGHAEDGVTYVIDHFPKNAPGAAVVGDALFAGSMGGAKQLADLAKRKIRDEIFNLPPATLICPGHGPVTTVELEIANNPFF